MDMKHELRIAALAAAVTGLLHGCSSLPERVETLEEARGAVQSLTQEPLAREAARSPFENAQAELARADEAYQEREDLEVVEHHAYLALRNAQIAEQLVAQERARNELEQGEVERTRVQLQAREREASRAQSRAEQAVTQAEQSQALAEQRAVTIEEQNVEAQQARERAAALEQELEELQAQQTERGLVLTLSDVLFDTNRAELNAGATPALERLAQFMMEYSDRRILVEGHTDSTGSEEYNRMLSARRADAVRSALLERGIASNRIETRGLGEQFPVASNETTAGRQLNRRVEIVISDQGGEFVSGTERRAAG
jgi:outer membrane protein OmpA-like peptidoglycan-associated protein